MPRTEPGSLPDWRPGAGLEILRLRAALMARVRYFFQVNGVMEVDTPILSRFAVTDPALEVFETHFSGPGSPLPQALYLHTSPEYFMKRLLAAGSGAIYQLCHVFRNEELGGRHNPEFGLLEWYRPDFDYRQLMDDVDMLLATVLDGMLDYTPARRISYRDWFIHDTGLDPWADDKTAFSAFVEANLGTVAEGMDDEPLDTWLDLLVTHWLEPRLGEGAVFIYDYPVSQASLAKIRQGEHAVAERFELYLNGVELANGFSELGDAHEQLRRFNRDNQVRDRAGRPQREPDPNLLAALHSGLPDCSGVALGFDRLVMCVAGVAGIGDSMPFAFARV